MILTMFVNCRLGNLWQEHGKNKEQSEESSMFGRILTMFLVNKELPFTSVDQAKVGKRCHDICQI